MAYDVRTRRSLHGAAELLLAGPQYRRSGTIRLRVTDLGFETVAEPDIRVQGGLLVVEGIPHPLFGVTYAMVAARAGIEVGAPEGLYAEGCGLRPDDVAFVEQMAATELLECLRRGDEALRTFAPDQTPVLWPEHFDVGITVDEVNYGVSLGDDYLDEPYMYVGPHTPRTGEFWDAPFGAARRLATTPEEIAEYFARGKRVAAG